MTGWAIAEDRRPAGAAQAEQNDADCLYRKLEEAVLPTFYQNRSRFVEIMRHAIALNGSFFNTQRMVQQYVLKAYYVSDLRPKGIGGRRLRFPPPSGSAGWNERHCDPLYLFSRAATPHSSSAPAWRRRDSCFLISSRMSYVNSTQVFSQALAVRSLYS